jgi:hypothetical protein
MNAFLRKNVARGELALVALLGLLVVVAVTACGSSTKAPSGCGPIGEPLAVCLDPERFDAGVDGAGCPSAGDDEVGLVLSGSVSTNSFGVESGPTDQFGECCYVVQPEVACF